MRDCVVCGQGGSDEDHIKTRGSGGTDDSFNKWFLCRRHHNQKHRKGLLGFLDLYPGLREILKSKGWEVETVFGKLVLTRKP